MGQNAYSQWTHFTPEGIKIPIHASAQLAKAAQVFQEEIQKRSQINIPIQAEKSLLSKGKSTLIILKEGDLKLLQATEIAQLAKLANTQKEGYKIVQINQNIVILGHDDRGCLYGVGKLLREMNIQRGQLSIQHNFQISSSPAFPIRGHQLGYRPKTNAYDAWTVKQYDQYIRDLAIFGANSIEIMPPRTDDDATSIHMKLPAMEMIQEQ
jgi:hypothetical protein